MVLTNNSLYRCRLRVVPMKESTMCLLITWNGQLYSYPYLLHDFASGNDGLKTCTPYSPPFATIKSGYQCAKNVPDGRQPGQQHVYYLIFSGSSSGLSMTAVLQTGDHCRGMNILSTLPYNTYGLSSGTSMHALPLPERWPVGAAIRQLQGERIPLAALLKAVACNSATESGQIRGLIMFTDFGASMPAPPWRSSKTISTA